MLPQWYILYRVHAVKTECAVKSRAIGTWQKKVCCIEEEEEEEEKLNIWTEAQQFTRVITTAAGLVQVIGVANFGTLRQFCVNAAERSRAQILL